ncbi:hypothetical protein ACIF6L_31425 [Kitasatospora sp. NPDC086009]|uniref:hypothetical protein n=1 Tax=unclassified Kitasatospora TaxID=2633591 RepID=UPI0037CAE86D
MSMDWGTAPTWISSVATTGALWATAVTLRRAQNKDRRTEADAVVCREARGDCCGATSRWMAQVTNDGMRPVYNVFLISFVSETGTMGESHRIANVLPPGVADHVHVPRPGEWSAPTAVLFRDADGTWWLRDLLEQSLYRQSGLPRMGRVRRTIRRLERESRWATPRQLARGGDGHRAPW